MIEVDHELWVISDAEVGQKVFLMGFGGRKILFDLPLGDFMDVSSLNKI